VSEFEYMPRGSPVNRAMVPPHPHESRLNRAIAAFDELNAADPRRLEDRGVARPLELVQAERLSVWVERVDPDASEALHLAARCQHVCRWKIPRDSHPDGRTGYLAWRKELARLHADTAERVLRSVGYDDHMVERVRSINLKRSLKRDPEAQAMEDALCLSFLEHELEAFAERHPRDKVVSILRKTWGKMGPRGHALAASLKLSEASRQLVEAALADPSPPEGEPEP
jgi:hypothetical protein